LRSVSVDNVAWNLRLFNNFRATNRLSFSAFGFYRGTNVGIQLTSKPMYFVNVGMRYTFLEDNRATLSLNYNDIFNTMRFRGEGVRPFAQNLEFEWESNTINLSFAYRFGGGKYSAKRRKNRDDNEKDGEGFF